MKTAFFSLFRWGWVLFLIIIICGFGLRTKAGDSIANDVQPTEVYALMGALGGLAIQPDGKIVVASGSYLYSVDTNSGVLGMMSSGAFRFNPDGTLDRSFHCNTDSIGLNDPQTTRLVSDNRGRLLIIGPFNSVNGKSRPGYAMLLPNGQLDDSFEPWRGFTNSPVRNSVAGSIYGAALLSNGWVSVASSMLDAPYPTAYSLDAAGRFVPPKPKPVQAKFPSALMFALTSTGLGIQREIDWTKNTRSKWNDWPPLHLTPGLLFPLWGEKPSALDMSEALQAIFDEVPLELCRYVLRLPDGGFILSVQEKGGSHFMRFDKNWRPDLSYTNHFETDGGSCLSLALQPDGNLLVAGEIAKLNGEFFTGVTRLDQTGAIDRSFHCQTIGGADTAGKADVISLALQGDGKIIIVGYFSEVNGMKCPHLARLNPDGSVDRMFQSHFTTLEGLKVLQHQVPVVQLTKFASANLTQNVTNKMSAAITGQAIIITSISMANGVAIIQLQGNPTQSYILQATDSLLSPSWSNITTNQTDSTGTGVLRDEEANSHPTRFYRVAVP